MDEGDAIRADHLLKRGANGGEEPCFFLRSIHCTRARFVVEFPDQMGEHFSIRFRAKIAIAILNQLFLERLIIFDHPVMHERKLAAGVEVRVCILVSHFAVRSPARVTDTKAA